MPSPAKSRQPVPNSLAGWAFGRAFGVTCAGASCQVMSRNAISRLNLVVLFVVREREAGQAIDAVVRGQHGGISVNLHRQPQVRVAHQFHSDAWLDTGERQVRTESVAEPMKVSLAAEQT